MSVRVSTAGPPAASAMLGLLSGQSVRSTARSLDNGPPSQHTASSSVDRPTRGGEECEMQTADRDRHDVVVVGGRVAGAATAMLLARLGHDVVVVDQASFPSDTVSTHSLARSGVVQLQRWGLLDDVLDSGAPAIRQVTFNPGGESISRTIKEKAGVDLLVAPRRYVLDTILAGAAERAGADVRQGVTVTALRRDGRGRVTGVTGHDRDGAPVEIGARHVVGADGLRSRVADLVGAAVDQAGPAGGAGQYAHYAGVRWD